MKNIFCKKVTETVYGCDHVQNPWLSELPWKMQTVLNQGLRAPDTHFCPNVKIICRWMRKLIFQNADENHTFMCSKNKLPKPEDVENELNYCSVHFATHFLYALEILAYKHPDEKTRKMASNYYRGVVAELWHFNEETAKELDIRLSDVDRKPEPKTCPPEEEDSYLRR